MSGRSPPTTPELFAAGPKKRPIFGIFWGPRQILFRGCVRAEEARKRSSESLSLPGGPVLGSSRRWGYRCLTLSGPRGPWDTVPPRVTYTHRWPPAPRDRLSGLELSARRQKIDPKQENEMKNFVKFPVQWGGLKIRVPDLRNLCPRITAPVLSPPRCLTLSGPAGPWSPLAALGAHPVGYRSARGRQDPHPTAGRFPGPWAPLVISD